MELSVALRLRGRLGESRAAVQAALQVTPADWQLWMGAAIVLSELGETMAARCVMLLRKICFDWCVCTPILCLSPLAPRHSLLLRYSI